MCGGYGGWYFEFDLVAAKNPQLAAACQVLRANRRPTAVDLVHQPEPDADPSPNVPALHRQTARRRIQERPSLEQCDREVAPPATAVPSRQPQVDRLQRETGRQLVSAPEYLCRGRLAPGSTNDATAGLDAAICHRRRRRKQSQG